MQDNTVREEQVTLQNNNVSEETVVCQGNPVSEATVSLQTNPMVETEPTVQDNDIIEADSEVVPTEYAEEMITAAAAYDEPEAVAAVEYSEKAPDVQDNRVEDESGQPVPVVPEEEEAPDDVQPRTDIIGSVAVSKDVTVGGKARVGDDALFKRDLIVEGWLQVNKVKGEFKTWLDSIEELAKNAKDKADGLSDSIGNALTGITKEMVESVLKGDIKSHTHSQYLTKDDIKDMTEVKNLLDEMFSLELDSAAPGGKRIKANFGVYTNAFLSAHGLNPFGNGGGAAYDRLDEWSAYDEDKSGWVLSALLGHDLHTRLAAIEGDYVKLTDLPSLTGYATEQWVLGKGYITQDALTPYLTKTDAASLYQPKGNYITSHQTLHTLTLQLNGTEIGTFNPTANKTINIGDVASAAALASHTGNTTVHISATERAQWNKAASDLSTILGSDSDTVINKWEEVVAFLDTYTEADTLAGLLGNKVDKVAGYGLSKNDFNDTLLAKLNGIEAGANRYIHPLHTVRNIAAAAGLVLASISVDAQGHVTDVGSKTLSQADIPTLSISKVDGLQSTLDSKLSEATFNAFKTAFDGMFELVNIGTDAAPLYAIHAKYGLYSDSFLSAHGRNDAGGSGGSGYSRLDAWSAYDSSKEGYVLSAKLGYDLYQNKADSAALSALASRVGTLEGKNYLDALTLNQSGSGNAVTSVGLSADKRTLTVTKGTTFLTQHQPLDYLNIKDIRGEERLPSYFGDFRLSAWFNIYGTPAANWYSGIHMRGWHGAYASWELCATSATSLADKNLYFRVGMPDAWEPWQTVLTSENSYISGDRITINGASITPLTTHQSLANYYTRYESDALFMRKVIYDATDGCLVRLNRPSTHNVMVTVLIEGNSYRYDSAPIKTIVQFYSYNITDAMVSATATHYGYDFGDIKVFCYDGHVYLWFKQSHNFQTFAITAICTILDGGTYGNAVEYITNAPMPTEGVTRLVTITPSKGLRTDNYASILDNVYQPKGNYLTEIPALDWSKITTGKPTTLGGYGITDAYTKSESNKGFLRNLFGGSTSTVKVDVDAVTSNAHTYDYRWENAPAGASIGSVLDLTYSVNWRTQLFASPSSKPYLFARSRYNGTTWSDWHQLAFITDNVASASRLQTGRLINGAAFDGTADVTTAKWGTARNITIGNTAKSVDGSVNVAWSLADIGALPLAGGTMANANLVTNLNADLLDGRHAYDFLWTGLTSATTDADTFGEYGMFKRPNASSDCNFPTAEGGSLINMQGEYGRTNQLFFLYGTPRVWYRPSGYSGGRGEWSELAFLSSNVASATKLADNATYTAWGRPFFANGKPQNVSGALSGITDITMSGVLHFVNTNVHEAFNDAISFLHGSMGAKILTDGLLIAGLYSNYSKIPPHGAYIEGSVITDGLLSANGGISTTAITATEIHLGPITLKCDVDKGGLQVIGGGLYTDSYLSAHGPSPTTVDYEARIATLENKIAQLESRLNA